MGGGVAEAAGEGRQAGAGRGVVVVGRGGEGRGAVEGRAGGCGLVLLGEGRFGWRRGARARVVAAEAAAGLRAAGHAGDGAAEAESAARVVGVVLWVEVFEVFLVDRVVCFVALGLGAEEEVGERVEPGLVALAGRGGEDDLSAGGDDDD